MALPTTTPFGIEPDTTAVWYLDGAAGSAAKLDNAAGNAALDLTEVNSPTAGTGHTTPTANGSGVCTANAGYIVNDDPALENANFTVEIIFKINSIGGSTQNVISRYDSASQRVFRLELRTDGKLQALIYNDNNNNSDVLGGSGSTSLNDGLYHYVAMSYSGGEYFYMLDPTSATDFETFVSPVVFGGDPDGSPAATGTTSQMQIGGANGLIGGASIEIDSIRYNNTGKSAADLYTYFSTGVSMSTPANRVIFFGSNA